MRGRGGGRSRRVDLARPCCTRGGVGVVGVRVVGSREWEDLCVCAGMVMGGRGGGVVMVVVAVVVLL